MWDPNTGTPVEVEDTPPAPNGMYPPAIEALLTAQLRTNDLLEQMLAHIRTT